MKRLLGAAALVLVAARMWGQGIPLASIAGAVTTEDGKPISGVTVRLSSPALQGTREGTTSATGEYLLALLPPGRYTAVFAMKGMRETTATVSLPAAAAVRLDQVLRPVAVAESVTVLASEARPARGGEVASNIPQKLLDELPAGRALRDAALLAPGVNENGPNASLGSASQRPAIMISGAMSFENLFLVNGVVVNENLRGQPQDLFIEDAIQETTVLTGRISAEYGRFTGGVVNMVTRSGGNQVSGSFRATLANDAWSANNAYDSALGIDNRVAHTNGTYEATLGFPLWKDRLWAFAAGRYADIAQSQETRPVAQPGNADLTPVPYVYGRRERRLEGKLTAAPAQSASLVASWIENRLDETDYAFNPQILSTETLMPRTLPNSMLAVNASGVLSSSLFLEGQYSRRRFTIEQTGPRLTDRILGTHLVDRTSARRWGAPQFGGEPPNDYDNDAWSLKGSRLFSTSSLGDHDLRAGYERFDESSLQENEFSASGFWISETRSIQRGEQIFPLLQNDGSTLIQWYPLAAPGAKTRLVTDSLYINDSAQLARHWSVSLGLRWDKNHDRDSSGALVSDSGRLSPRLGARFDPRGDGRLVLDAGYGEYTAKINDKVANAASPAGQVAQFFWTYRGPCINCDPTVPTSSLVSREEALSRLFAWFDSIGGTGTTPTAGALLPGFSTRIAPGGLRSPYAREFSVGAESAAGPAGSVRADFLYRDYRDQYNGRIDLSTGKTSPDQRGNVYDMEEIGNSGRLKRRYVAAQVQAQYRLGMRVSLAGTYTWSHLTGNFIGEFNRTSATWGTLDEYPEYKKETWNAPTGDLTGRGVSPFSPDQRHRARLWLVWQVPLRLGATSVSALEAFDSGLGYEAVGSIDPRQPYVANPGYANPLGNVGGVKGVVDYFFTKPAAYRTDDITHTDLTLNWSLPVHRGTELFVRLQVSNLFNERGVVAVDTTVQTSQNLPKTLAPFNPFTETPRQGVNYQLGPQFGKPTSAAGYQPPRTSQFAVGVRF